MIQRRKFLKRIKVHGDDFGLVELPESVSLFDMDLPQGETLLKAIDLPEPKPTKKKKKKAEHVESSDVHSNYDLPASVHLAMLSSQLEDKGNRQNRHVSFVAGIVRIAAGFIIIVFVLLFVPINIFTTIAIVLFAILVKLSQIATRLGK